MNKIYHCRRLLYPASEQTKWWLMRLQLLVFSILLMVFQLKAEHTRAQNLTLKVKNRSLETVLQEIKRQSGYDILYNPQLLRAVAAPVTTTADDTSLESVLADIFKKQNQLEYLIDQQAIIVRRKSNAVSAPGDNREEPQQNPVRGRVVDSLNRPLQGATVRVLDDSGRQTTFMTKTDAQGTFVLMSVPEQYKLHFSFLGYQDRTVDVANGVAEVLLHQLSNQLTEVVVNAGYYKVNERLKTGNITRIDADILQSQPVSNPLAALQGRVPGMLVTQNTGVPGGAFNIQIRGRTAIDQNITSDQPLFVIDGIPFGSGETGIATGLASAANSTLLSVVNSGISPFNGINPQDIESIEVLKDADATAIYGSRGANGVILITTKSGRSERATLSVNTHQGISYVNNRVSMMNTSEYISMRKKAFENDRVEMTPVNAFDVLLWDTTQYTDFSKELLGTTANTHNTQLSLSGGTSTFSYSLRGGYHKENTIFSKDHKSERINMGINLSQYTSDRRAGITFSGGYAQNTDDLVSTDLANLNTVLPHVTLLDDDGALVWEMPGHLFVNPLAYLHLGNETKTNTLYANVRPVFQVGRGFSLSANIGYNVLNTDQSALTPIAAINPNPSAGGTRERQVEKAFVKNQSWTLEPMAEYERVLLGGELKLMMGGTFQNTFGMNTRLQASGFNSDQAMKAISNANSHLAWDGSSQYKYAAFFGRIHYNFGDTYLLNLTGRRDGSSRFGPGKQFANFGAAGAAWIFSNTAGLRDELPWLSFGKIRMSMGSTGNDKISDYQFLDTWLVANYTPEMGGQVLFPNKLFNPDYHWESTLKTELALEIGLFNDRIQFSPVYFRNSSSNQLVRYQLPEATGFLNVVANLPATVVNSGLEITLSAALIESKDFKWKVDFNGSLPKNRLKAYPGLESSPYSNTYMIGKPLNAIMRAKYTGVDPETGVYTVEDTNGDGTINALDYQYRGHLDPRFHGGLMNTFRYKNLLLDFFFLFRKTKGQNYLFQLRDHTPGMLTNIPAFIDQVTWKNPGDQALVQKYTATSQNRLARTSVINHSDGIFSDASFLRLNNVSISYLFPKGGIEKLGIGSLRLYALGQNLWTISSYEIGDPETQSFRTTPPLTTITFGAQITL